MLLRLEGVSRTVAHRVLFAGVSLAIHRGDRIGLVGANGVGKTTLLSIAAGDEPPDAGHLVRARGVRVGRLRQEIDPSRGRTVRDEVASALSELDALERDMRDLEGEMERCGREGRDVPAALADRYDDCRTRFELAGGFERAARVDRVLEGLGFDEAARERTLSSFSGGWLMRVELAKLLLSEPDVLLLDEPTNHLDLPSIQWFEDTLADYGGAVVMVSHDRALLRRHADRVAELESGRLTLYDGGWDAFLERKARQREELLARKRTQDRQVAQAERFIERFRAKNTKARQVKSKVKALDRMERVSVPEERRASMRLRIPPAARAGEEVLRLEDVHKSYGDVEVYRGADFLLRRGERVALVGKNGAGKSTLLRIAAGVLAPDAGERLVGHNVSLAFYAQHQLEALAGEREVLEELESVATLEDLPRLRGHLGAFLFSGDDVRKKVSILSGGEKARLALAKLLLRPANLLVLDEPTNHLDVTAREVLEAALLSYTGTLLFITHDRAIIDALATRVVEIDAGVLESFPGGWDDYRRAKSRAEDEGAKPASRAAGVDAGRGVAKRERMAARVQERERVRRLTRARRRLTAVEEEIARREEELGELDCELANPEVYRDGEAVRDVEERREEARELVGALYQEWEALVAEVEAAEATGD